ncbi:MAG: hypothetical protein QXH51_07930 [Candidatus Bathyarchaeia archaeon]
MVKVVGSRISRNKLPFLWSVEPSRLEASKYLSRVYCSTCSRWFHPLEADRMANGKLMCPECGRPLRTKPKHTKKDVPRVRAS